MDGNRQWIKNINLGWFSGGTVGDIVVGKNNDIYITGNFQGRAVFGNDTLNNSESSQMFLAKYTPDGSCSWVRNTESSDKSIGKRLATDQHSNVYLTGVNTDTATIGSFTVAPGGFLAKYDSGGNCLWAKKLTNLFWYLYNLPDVEITAMNVTGNLLFFCGTENNSTFNLDTFSISHPGKRGHIFGCFDLNGNIQWIREAISNNGYSAMQIGTDSENNFYLTGSFEDTINFAGTLLVTDFTNGMFTAKYDYNGNLIFARKLPVENPFYSLGSGGSGVICDSSGYFYVTGYFNGTAAFGPDTITSQYITDMFLARFSPDGDCMGAISFPFSGGYEVKTDMSGNPVVFGLFTHDVSIGDDFYQNYGEDDLFIAKCSPITGIEEKLARNSQLLIYANPNDGRCNIELPQDFVNEKTLTLRIFNSQGQLIQNASISTQSENILIDIHAEAAGTYNVILSNGKKNYTGKIVFK